MEILSVGLLSAVRGHGISRHLLARDAGRAWDQTEADLQRDWESVKGKSRLTWEQARAATRNAWHRVEQALPGDADGDGR